MILGALSVWSREGMTGGEVHYLNAMADLEW
jgi:hypothetical protein